MLYTMSMLSENYGDGWLSCEARDMLQVYSSFVFIGDEQERVLRAVALGGTPGRTTNMATVDRVINELGIDLNLA